MPLTDSKESEFLPIARRDLEKIGEFVENWINIANKFA
jgi:hypothetical protein